MFSIIETRTVPTIQMKTSTRPIIFHSKYDPLKEATVWARTVAEEVYHEGDIVVFGLAAGYHIVALARLLPERKIRVLEGNMAFYNWFIKSPFYDAIAKLPQVKISSLSSDIEIISLFDTHSANIRTHKNGMDLLPAEFEGLKEALKDIEMGQFSYRHQKDKMFSNFRKNHQLKDSGIQQLKNQYKGKKAILIAAGPSLDKQLPILKEIQHNPNFVLGAVGTAMKPLEKAGITPDFFVIIDPNEGTYGQLTDVSFPQTPFYYMSTAFHDTILLHKGPRHIFYQVGWDLASEQAAKRKEPLIETGGSVATALLDLLVYFGCETIALVGQDLAYTDGVTHAKEANAVKEKEGQLEVLAWDGQSTVKTDRNLNSYRKWMESYAQKNPHLHLFDCTEGGANINYFQSERLIDFILIDETISVSH